MAHPEPEVILKNLALDMKRSDNPLFRELGRFLLRSIQEGDSKEMIVNHMDSIVHDFDDLRNTVRQILKVDN